MLQTLYWFHGSYLFTLFLLQWNQQVMYPSIIWLGFILLILFGYYQHWYRWIAPIVLAMGLAFMSVQLSTHQSSPASIDWYSNSTYQVLHGTIAQDPDKRPLQTKYTINITSLDTGSGYLQPAVGLVLFNDERQWPEYNQGDAVQISGILQKPKPIEAFQYDQYLSRYNIYSVMYRGSISKEDLEFKSKKLAIRKNIVQHSLFGIKEKFERQINRLYSEPHASFMAGLLTGSRKGIPAHLMEDFNTTGLTHIIAISGYNIAIVILFIGAAFGFVPKRYRIIPIVICIVGFTLFVGASPAVVRAAIMGCLSLLALQLGRENTIRITLLWTAFFMTVINPKLLWYDAGFQLSFLAVLGLLEFSPMLEKWFKCTPDTFAVRESLTMTMAAQLVAVPLIIVLFGRLSLIAPLANILVAPLLPLAMLFGFVGTMLSSVWWLGGQLIAYLGWACLELIIIITKTLAKVPYASVEIEHLGWIAVMFYYGLLLFIKRAQEYENDDIETFNA